MGDSGRTLGWWIYHKLHRAEKHINDTEASIKSFLKERPYRLTSEFTPNGDGTTTWTRKADLGPQGWVGGTITFLMGDAVHNMRSALDYIATYLWVREGRLPYTNQVGFPIYKERSKFRKARGQKVGGLAPKAQAVIQSLQPYKRGQDADPLWVLNALDVIDKHHRINLTGYSLMDTSFFDLEGVADVDVLDSEVFPGPFVNGAILATALIRFPIGVEGGEVNVRQDFPADVAFDQTGPAPGLLVVPTLREVLDYIRTEVIPRLEPFGEVLP